MKGVDKNWFGPNVPLTGQAMGKDSAFQGI